MGRGRLQFETGPYVQRDARNASTRRVVIESSATQIAHQHNGGVIHYNDVGVAYLLSKSWQIGGRAGWAANRNTPTRYALIALAARF